MFRAQEWLDHFDGIAAGSGNLEEGVSSKMINGWIERAGYKNLDKKIAKASSETKAKSKPTNSQTVEKYSGGKKETNKLSGVMATGFDSVIHLL